MIERAILWGLRVCERAMRLFERSPEGRAAMRARGLGMVIGREAWFKLPLDLRMRYWRATEYGKNPPNDELWREIQEELKKQ